MKLLSQSIALGIKILAFTQTEIQSSCYNKIMNTERFARLLNLRDNYTKFILSSA